MPPRQKLEGDVVVVGAGGSGLAAALAAAAQGAEVIVLEKAGSVGGTTSLAIGSITAAETCFQSRNGIVDHADDHFDDMDAIAPNGPDHDNLTLRRILVDHGAATVEWLSQLGVVFFGPMSEHPHRQPRMHNALPNAGALVRALWQACRRRGVRIHTAVRVADPVMSDGRVVGVAAESPAGPLLVYARRGVILASGDFSGSEALKRRFVPEQAHVQPINPRSTGDGQLIGEKAGGRIVNGTQMLGPSLRFVAPAGGLFQRLPPLKSLATAMRLSLAYAPGWLLRPFILSFVTTNLAPSPKLFESGAILVNKLGRRFTDEKASPAADVARQPDGTAYIIFDASIAELYETWPNYISTAPGVAYAYLSDYRRSRKDIFHRKPTVAQLAEAIGVPADALAAAVSGAGLGRGPFYALGPAKAWIIVTDGGLAVDEEHRVLDAKDRPVPGLYAVGSAGQGGLRLNGHGHRLAWAFTSGRRAGAAAAQATVGRALADAI